jgi:hypothetical protein
MKVKRKEREQAFIVIRQGRIRDETRDSGTETGRGREPEEERSQERRMTRERKKGKTGDDQRQSRKREDERERSGSVRKILEVLVCYIPSFRRLAEEEDDLDGEFGRAEVEGAREGYP